MGTRMLLARVGCVICLCVGGLLSITNREFGGNINSSHVALLQIGVALIGAALFHKLLSYSWGPIVFAIIVGLGVTVNNLYIDIFKDSSARQATFWQQFEARYPVLPEPPMFFFDVQDGAVWSDVRTYCDIESHLRKRYGIHAIADTQEQAVNDLKRGRLIRSAPYQIETHAGLEQLDPKTTTVIRYRNGAFQ